MAPRATDPPYDECLAALSRPASDPGMSRRRFLLGAAAATAAVTAGGVALNPFGRDRAGAAPIGPTDGVLVTILLGGGNDGMNTLVPYGQGRYNDLRGTLGIPAAQVLAIDPQYGFHPSLPKLRARYDLGKVAVVRGVGQPADDLSHFTSMATFMAGTAGTSRSSGWLGRYADGLADSPDGLRVVTTGSSVPLHLQGARTQVTALPEDGNVFGANTADAWEVSAQTCATAFAAQPVGRGPWADRFAAAGAAAVDTARRVSPVFSPALPDGDLVRQLTLAARLVNADLGIRVLNTSLGSFDTHDNQAYEHAQLLTELDDAIEAFYATLSPTFARRVTILTFSEFGRRAERNGSAGTDHGTASSWFVVGDQVSGGLHGDQPSLAANRLDARGNLLRTVDFRSVYATVLERWLGADADAVLGGRFDRLGLFAAGPAQPTGVPRRRVREERDLGYQPTPGVDIGTALNIDPGPVPG